MKLEHVPVGEPDGLIRIGKITGLDFYATGYEVEIDGEQWSILNPREAARAFADDAVVEVYQVDGEPAFRVRVSP